MALMRCPECRDKVSSKAAACPHCGYPVLGERNGKDPLSQLSLLVICVFLLAIVATWGTIFFPDALGGLLKELALVLDGLASLLV